MQALDKEEDNEIDANKDDSNEDIIESYYRIVKQKAWRHGDM